MFDKDDAANPISQNRCVRISGSLTFENIKNEARDIFLFLQIHPGHRLVKQKDFRLQGQCSSELNSFLHPVGQNANNFLSHRRHFQKVDNLLDRSTVLNFLMKGPAQIQCPADKILFHQNVPGGHDVVLSAEPGVEFDVLKGSRNAEFSQLIRALTRNSSPLVIYLAFLRLVKTVDAIKQSCFAGTIGADDRQNFVIADVQAYLHKCMDTAKAQRQALNSQFNLMMRFHRLPSPKGLSFSHCS